MEFKKEIYPLDFTDDQKLEYDLLVRQSKLLFPEAEVWTIKMAVEAYVKSGGKRADVSPEEIEAYKSRYDNSNMVYETPQNIILDYKPAPVELNIISSNIIESSNVTSL